jgi:hypothetical protein
LTVTDGKVFFSSSARLFALEKASRFRDFSLGNDETRHVFDSDVPKDLKTRNIAKNFSYAIYGVGK